MVVLVVLLMADESRRISYAVQFHTCLSTTHNERTKGLKLCRRCVVCDICGCEANDCEYADYIR